jgi:hypothetical protein
MIVPNTGDDANSASSISSGSNFNPMAFGVIFVLDSIVTLNSENTPPTNANLSKTYAKVKGKAVSFKNNTDANSDTYAYEISY